MSILRGHWLPLFWTSCDPPHGFQSQGGSLTYTLTCLCVVNLRVMSGTIPASSTNRGVHCISMYTTAKGRQQWTLTFGSSEIQSRAVEWTCECAIHSATPAGFDNIILNLYLHSTFVLFHTACKRLVIPLLW